MAYEWSQAEHDLLYQRIEAIEDMLNNVQTALNNLAPKSQLKQISVLMQGQIDTLSQEVTALKQRVATLETEVAALQAASHTH